MPALSVQKARSMRFFTLITGFSLLLMLAACGSYHDPWPSLSGPLDQPGHKGEPRAEQKAMPSPAAHEPGSKAALNPALSLADIEKAFKADRQSYLDLRGFLDTASESYQGLDPLAPWHDAQLALTRISQLTDRIDALADQSPASKSLRDKIETFVLSERALLERLRPAP